VSDGKSHTFCNVGLAAVGCAEGHRRRCVEHEPGNEHPLGELDADVCLPRARRDVPLDAADVIARLIGPDLVELRSNARERRAIVA